MHAEVAPCEVLVARPPEDQVLAEQPGRDRAAAREVLDPGDRVPVLDQNRVIDHAWLRVWNQRLDYLKWRTIFGCRSSSVPRVGLQDPRPRNAPAAPGQPGAGMGIPRRGYRRRRVTAAARMVVRARARDTPARP